MRRVPKLSAPWLQAFETRGALSFDEQLQLGSDLYQNGHPWHAHEVWEEVWQAYQGPGRRCLQGLIQLAAARHHTLNENIHGVTTLLRRSLASLSKGEAFTNLDVQLLKKSITELLNQLDEGQSLASQSFPEVSLSIPSKAP